MTKRRDWFLFFSQPFPDRVNFDWGPDSCSVCSLPSPVSGMFFPVLGVSCEEERSLVWELCRTAEVDILAICQAAVELARKKHSGAEGASHSLDSSCADDNTATTTTTTTETNALRIGQTETVTNLTKMFQEILMLVRF